MNKILYLMIGIVMLVSTAHAEYIKVTSNTTAVIRLICGHKIIFVIGVTANHPETIIDRRFFPCNQNQIILDVEKDGRRTPCLTNISFPLRRSLNVTIDYTPPNPPICSGEDV